MRPLPLLVAISLCGCTGSGPAFKTDDDPASFVGTLDTGALDDSGGTTTDTATDSGTSGSTGCANPAVGTFPADQDDDAYFRTAVRATLASYEAGAAIHVTDAGGAEVPGVSTVTDAVVNWTGDPLSPSSAYTATLDWSCGSYAWTFTTNAVGAPIAADPVGVVYELALENGDWVEPVGVGTLLASQLDTPILVSPVALDASGVTLLVGAGDGGVQDLCVATVEHTADWDDPAFSSSVPFALALDVADLEMVIDGATVSGAFAPDASAIDGVAVTGVIDTRSIVAAFPEIGTDDDSVCELVSTFGVTCVPCPDGTELCLDVYIDAIDGPSVPGTLVPRTDADIAADAACP